MTHPNDVVCSEPVELVIFDCDGVLVDSKPIAFRVEARLITDLGWPVTEAEVIERFAGRIYSAIQVANGKPAPDLCLYAAEQMGVAPSRCVVVEDSPSGVHAAPAAGMRCVAHASGLVPGGSSPRPTNSRHHGDVDAAQRHHFCDLIPRFAYRYQLPRKRPGP